MKVAVIGGGIVGVTTAYELLREGHEVVVIDRQPDVALECSYANGGYIAVSQAVPWSSPGVPTKTLLGLLGKDPPILLRAAQLPSMWRWGLEFLMASRANPSWENTKRVLRLALYSHSVLKETREREPIDYAPIMKGSLKVFTEQSSLDEAIAVSQTQAPLGLKHVVWSARDCAQKVPALQPAAEKLAGGIHYPDEENGDCYRFARGLARLCMERGATFRFGVNVNGFRCEGSRITGAVAEKDVIAADAFVLAAGAASPLLVSSLGIRLPVLPVKGYSLTVPRETWPDAPDMPVLDEKRKFGYAPLATDRLRMSGFAEIAGYDTTPEPRRVTAFVRAFTSLFPQLEQRIKLDEIKPFCCLRPVTPAGPPILGPSRFKNLYYNVGQGHLGWTLAHGSARLVTALVSDKAADIDMTGYLPARSQ
jgi:D-amino-acid dehydrogenase